LPLLENYAPFPRKYRNSGKQLIFFLICWKRIRVGARK
jgi:hypothetical protein